MTVKELRKFLSTIPCETRVVVHNDFNTELHKTDLAHRYMNVYKDGKWDREKVVYIGLSKMKVKELRAFLAKLNCEDMIIVYDRAAGYSKLEPSMLKVEKDMACDTGQALTINPVKSIIIE